MLLCMSRDRTCSAWLGWRVVQCLARDLRVVYVKEEDEGVWDCVVAVQVIFFFLDVYASHGQTLSHSEEIINRISRFKNIRDFNFQGLEFWRAFGASILAPADNLFIYLVVIQTE